ncbi:MAG: dCTP deaminase [Minisyncoccia bacterium]
MILSGADIRQYMKHGNLAFSPELRDDQFQQNGIDMILAAADTEQLPRGGFTLGCTKEHIWMPNDLCAFVQLRSTWARKGFMIPPTVIDAGFSGMITLEIASFADQRLPIGERFAHVIFCKLCSPSEPYDGKYQHQQGITGAR